MKIYIVRHGESESNIDKTVHKDIADHDIALSSRGANQARRAAKLIGKHLGNTEFPCKYVRLWTSPYKRTRETADVIEEELNPWIRDRKEHVLLCEQQFGLFDGLSNRELKAKYPDEYEHYRKCEKSKGRFWARMPLGESRFDVACRVHQSFGTFHRDNERHGIDKIIVVCHGITLRAFVMMWCHYPYEWFEEEKNPRNCAVRYIEDGSDRGYLPLKW